MGTFRRGVIVSGTHPDSRVLGEYADQEALINRNRWFGGCITVWIEIRKPHGIVFEITESFYNSLDQCRASAKYEDIPIKRNRP